MMDRLPATSLLDTGALPVGDIAMLAKREGARPRPAYQAHKWFARRFAVTARSLVTASVTPADAQFWPAYYGDASCAHVSVLDPFMGGGSTIAAALAVGYESIGLEIDPAFFRMAVRAIPRLARAPINCSGKPSSPVLVGRQEVLTLLDDTQP